LEKSSLLGVDWNGSVTMPKLSFGSSEISKVLKKSVSTLTKPTFVVGIKRDEDKGTLGLLLAPAAEEKWNYQNENFIR